MTSTNTRSAPAPTPVPVSAFETWAMAKIKSLYDEVVSLREKCADIQPTPVTLPSGSTIILHAVRPTARIMVEGKYKGMQHSMVVFSDPEYVVWLAKQGLAVRYGFTTDELTQAQVLLDNPTIIVQKSALPVKPVMVAAKPEKPKKNKRDKPWVSKYK